MGREKRGPVALEAWAKQLINGYPNVAVNNMTTSWRNGLAFCALIHRFKPNLIEYDKLDPLDIIGNCSLAFETAENKLGIPALLDPEDMVAYDVPDRLSILTYVAQFYTLFKNAEKASCESLSTLEFEHGNEDDEVKTGSENASCSPKAMQSQQMLTNVTYRDPDISIQACETQSQKLSNPCPSSSSVSGCKQSHHNHPAMSDDTYAKDQSLQLAITTPFTWLSCSKCFTHVYISERTVFMKKLYHRNCFRCQVCDNILNPNTAHVTGDHQIVYCDTKSCQIELKTTYKTTSIKQSLLEKDYSTTTKDNIYPNELSTPANSDQANCLAELNSKSKSGELEKNSKHLDDAKTQCNGSSSVFQANRIESNKTNVMLHYTPSTILSTSNDNSDNLHSSKSYKLSEISNVANTTSDKRSQSENSPITKLKKRAPLPLLEDIQYNVEKNLQPTDPIELKMVFAQEKDYPTELNPFESEQEHKEESFLYHANPFEECSADTNRTINSCSDQQKFLPQEKEKVPYNPFDIENSVENHPEYDQNQIQANDGNYSAIQNSSGVSVPCTEVNVVKFPKLSSRKTHRAPLPPASCATFFSHNEQPNVHSKVGNSGSFSYRKKRRAPPPKRRVEPIPEAKIQTEMQDLDIKLKELERQGIVLEENIRKRMCQEKEVSCSTDKMTIQLWNIVNEKNNILQRQTELEFLRKGHRLEELQSELDFKLRVLLETPLDQRLPDQSNTENLLLNELLQVVEDRNEVVNWLDYYKQLDNEEEYQINQTIKEFKHRSALSKLMSHLKIKQKETKKQTK